jgi:hypothetical protein
MKNARDKYFVHTEFTSNHPAKFPDIKILKLTGLEMRDIICEVILKAKSAETEMLTRFKNLVLWNSNKKYLQDLKSDADNLKGKVSI